MVAANPPSPSHSWHQEPSHRPPGVPQRSLDRLGQWMRAFRRRQRFFGFHAPPRAYPQNQLACPIPTAVCFKRKDCGKGLPWEDLCHFNPFHPFQVGGVLKTCFEFAVARTDALLWGMWSGALRAIRTPWSYARRIGCLFVCLGMVWSNMVLTNGCRKIPGFVG